MCVSVYNNNVCTCICVYLCMCVSVYNNVCTCICVYVYICVCVYLCIIIMCICVYVGWGIINPGAYAASGNTAKGWFII